MSANRPSPVVDLHIRLSAIDNINANRIKTDDAINYFGMPIDLADALRITVSTIRSWGEYVPEFYAESINKIIARDAVINE